MAATDLLTVGELARRSGVAVSTLHYYESRGLLSAARSAGNQRRYARAALRRVAFIRAAQALGIGLAEIGAALADLHQVTSNLRRQKDKIQSTIHYLEPYASVLINVLGTGPWFDAYVPNLVGMFSGEFVPGRR